MADLCNITIKTITSRNFSSLTIYETEADKGG